MKKVTIIAMTLLFTIAMNARQHGINNDSGDADPFASEWKDARTGYLAQIYYNIKNNCYKLNISDIPYANKLPMTILEAEEKGDELYFANTEGYKGGITGDKLVIKGPDGFEFVGQKVTRKPPTLGATPPKDAVVLFDGTSMDAWGSLAPKEWVNSNGEGINSVKLIPGESFEMIPGKGSIITKEVFGDCKLHVEFRLLGEVTNGGVYMMARYEFNIKDSYGQGKGSSTGDWGNIAKPEYPDSEFNYALPPMVWQTMDIDFTTPRFDRDGKKIANAKATMYLNGELIYKDAEVEALKGAGGRLGEAATGPLYLQEHGTAYQFRNIWICPR